MATVKIVLRKEQKKDGTSPLAIRITKDRKSTFIYLEYSIKASDWDAEKQLVKKSHSNSTRLNKFITKRLAEAMDESLDEEASHKLASVKTIRQKIKPSAGNSVFQQTDLYLQRFKEDGKYNQYATNKTRVNRLKEYLKNDLSFADLTIPIIERYKSWIKTKYKVSERTAVNHIVVVRDIFSQAIKEGACDPKFYPFGKGKIKIKIPDSTKMGLSKEDVTKIEALELEGLANHARNVWLFSFYFAGMRISDVLRLKWSDFQNNRLHYTMGKNEKVGSLKIPEKALAILKQYEVQKEDINNLVFPDLKQTNLKDKFATQRDIATKTNTINKYLRTVVKDAAGITQKLSMHVARHTFGNISGDAISPQMLQKLYRHSSITTTIGYQANFIHKDADDALDAVIG